MDRQNLIRRLVIFVGIAFWAFLALALVSFSPLDWPSHQAWPYPPLHNLCGRAGAFLAFYLYYAIGQGVFPIVFFSGICLLLILFRNRISDLWLRGIGLLLLSVAFAAIIHLVHPGSPDSLPEGYGGILGISTVAFLKFHFASAGAA